MRIFCIFDYLHIFLKLVTALWFLKQAIAPLPINDGQELKISKISGQHSLIHPIRFWNSLTFALPKVIIVYQDFYFSQKQAFKEY